MYTHLQTPSLLAYFQIERKYYHLSGQRKSYKSYRWEQQLLVGETKLQKRSQSNNNNNNNNNSTAPTNNKAAIASQVEPSIQLLSWQEQQCQRDDRLRGFLLFCSLSSNHGFRLATPSKITEIIEYRHRKQSRKRQIRTILEQSSTHRCNVKAKSFLQYLKMRMILFINEIRPSRQNTGSLPLKGGESSLKTMFLSSTRKPRSI